MIGTPLASPIGSCPSASRSSKATSLSLDVDDAIVNAANKTLLGGSGVDGAIHRAAAGPKLREACSLLDGCATGEAKITPGFRFQPATSFTPSARSGAEANAARTGCSRRVTQKVSRLPSTTGLSSIAFPSISTGAYGFPPPRAAHITVIAVLNGIRNTPSLKRVVFCCFGKDFLVHHDTALAAALGPGK